MAQIALKNYRKISGPDPEISIVIPAYNEEESIVSTLASLCSNRINLPIEIIVVNNNSQDNTESLISACGVICVNETQQGITFARNTGLLHAKGKYILNADADTIYPENWIDLMTSPLINSSDVAITYGRFSLIPTEGTKRIVYFFYEYLTELSRSYNKKFKDEAVNVYGFNSGFRRAQGLTVDSFNHPQGTNEDGWLAVKLRKEGYGRLHCVTDPKALVWTTDRRIQMDGGIIKGGIKRFKRLFNLN
ncbi:glycosyl transferase family 2 [Pedobacter sp. HMWF019]|nr:glycosyl transferase family 2 [Pedobacter sp. HMWF019]